MGMNIAQKIITAHIPGFKGKVPSAGEQIHIHIDQTLTQDSTGCMAYLQFEAMDVPRVKTDLSVSYVDHNTLQLDFRNPDDHRYLRTVAAKHGIVFPRVGTGICHQLHVENFAKPGVTLLGSDSHTPTSSGVGALAMGAGGLSVAMAMAGELYPMSMPEVFKINLTGHLQGFASAKDVILHLLGKFSVKGGLGKIFEYVGPGVKTLTVTDRACIANMGTELGLTSSVFPSDEITREFLTAMDRPEDFKPIDADSDAVYDGEVNVDLSTIVPLVARPHMPDKVCTVAELDGLQVDQVVVGSCTNSSYADLHMVADILRGKRVSESCDFLLAPGSKQVMQMLASEGSLEVLMNAGVRVLECCCGPCIGSGGAPSTNGVSARTFNRNFEGRSGSKSALVYLVSPATAAMAGLRGKFSDPATWGDPPKVAKLPETIPNIRHLFIMPPADGSEVEILRGPNIVALEPFPRPHEKVDSKIVMVCGDQITTDHIMPAGAQINSLRSNLPAISEYAFSRMDENFAARAKANPGGVIIAGENYGQGSSREQAAMAPRFLGIQTVIAKSFARIHRDNLVNCGIIPFIFCDKADYDWIEQDQRIIFKLDDVKPKQPMVIKVGGKPLKVTNDLAEAELECILAGGLLSQMRHNDSGR